jgi:acetyltransferase-like isoleucine patch superfamily enzyme
MFDLWVRVSNKVRSTLWRWLFRWDFFEFGTKTTVLKPLRIQGAKRIAIGSNVTILDSAWLLALDLKDSPAAAGPLIRIGDGTSIGHFAHIVSMGSVQIGAKVLIADRVYISDNLHGFENVEVAIIDQPVQQRASVEIGDGSWLGENVCIIGARIGRNCVVAANAVVTRDVPDYCVVAGAPARVIKRYDTVAKSWVIVKN